VEALTGWWDDYLAGSIVVFKIFMASLSLMVIFGLIGAAAKLSNSIIAKKNS
jgi:polar amino acid transport system permease protein